MRIRETAKLQQGGAAPPFVSWSPVPSTPVAPSVEGAPSAQANGGEGDLLSKDMVKLLMENGLPSDVNAFVASMQELYNDPVYRATGNLNPSGLSSRYLSIIGRINNIKYGKEAYDESLKRLTQNGGLSDVAISTTGRMVVQNLETGELEQITPGEYKEKHGEYRAMTNGDIAHLRAVNPSMAYNNNIFGILDNGIGSKTIQSYLNEAISQLGSTTMKSDNYLSKKGNAILTGLGQIENNPEVQNALLSDGVYKVSNENKSNLEQSKQALSYIMNTLPENAKTYLRAKAAMAGLDPDKGAQTILTQFIASKFETSVTQSVDFDSAASKAAGFTSSDGTKSTAKVGMLDLVMNNDANDERIFTIRPGISTQGSTKALHWNVLTNLKDGLPVGVETVSDIMQTSILSAAGDQMSVTFGGKSVSPELAKQLIYDPTSGLTKVTLPSKEGENGEIVPDLDILNKIDQAESRISQFPGMSEQEKRQIYEDYEVGQYYDVMSDPNKINEATNVHNFYVVKAIGSAESGKIDEDSPYVSKVTKEERDGYIRLLNDVINDNLTGKRGKVPYPIEKGFFRGLFTGGTSIYTGNLYIAEAKDKRSARVISGTLTQPKQDLFGTASRDYEINRGALGINEE